MNTRALRMVGIGLGISIAATGCADSGGLRRPDAGADWCNRAGLHQPVLYHFDLDLTEGSVVTILGLRGLRPHGMTLTRVRIGDGETEAEIQTQTASIGESDGQPLAGRELAYWKRSEPAVGTKIRYGPYRELLAVAERTEKLGTVDDVLIDYEQDGQRHEVSTRTIIRMSSDCPVADD